MANRQMMDVLVHTSELPWKPLGPGTSYRLLRVSEETGVWTIMLKMEAGAVFAPHKHLGASELFMLQGLTKDRQGLTRTGDYQYEPIGMEHDATTAIEDSTLIFTAHGPIAFYNDQGGIGMVLDWEFFVKDQAQSQDPKLSVKKMKAA